MDDDWSCPSCGAPEGVECECWCPLCGLLFDDEDEPCVCPPDEIDAWWAATVPAHIFRPVVDVEVRDGLL